MPDICLTVSGAAELRGQKKGGSGIFYFEKSRRGHGVGNVGVTEGRGIGRDCVCVRSCVLHKLSSHSACIPWLTVLKAKWNVGQTPPPFSSCACFFFFFTPAVTNNMLRCFYLAFFVVCLFRDGTKKDVDSKPSVLFGYVTSLKTSSSSGMCACVCVMRGQMICLCKPLVNANCSYITIN